jgi:uncharacterized protein
MEERTNKRKIINDPVYGFVNIPNDLVFDLVDHPYFQRLRRIKQLGLTTLVYPGANHTRFQHALGAMHLMVLAINIIRSKGHEITNEEAEAVIIAILLHDIGHGPYSHALEKSIIEGVNHEIISSAFMHNLNNLMNSKLELAIAIFKNRYQKKFLHQLVASQLDMDRLDYLKRDSFFTGVTEGVIGSDRIIKMLNVYNDQLVIDHKGIYSIEKFLVARRLMYWQVYLHKTVIAAENLLLKTLQRARELAKRGTQLFAPEALAYFLYKNINQDDLHTGHPHFDETLEHFSMLDDHDIVCAIKSWQISGDKVLSTLSKAFTNRKLYRIELQNEPFNPEKISIIRQACKTTLGLNDEENDYFVFHGQIENNAYSSEDENIKILTKNGRLIDITEASDMLNVSVLSKVVTKYFLCYPKKIEY